jgi:hypothetical protein
MFRRHGRAGGGNGRRFVGGAMQVTIMYRNNWFGGDGWTYYPIKIIIADNCPICGKKRGKPYPYRFRECGEWFTVDKWDNPCGHLDTYRDCIIESEQLKKNKIVLTIQTGKRRTVKAF